MKKRREEKRREEKRREEKRREEKRREDHDIVLTGRRFACKELNTTNPLN